MNTSGCKTIILSDFNAANFSAYLSNDGSSPHLHVVDAPYGQVMSQLLDRRSDCWQGKFDLAVVWTQPEKIIESFNRVLNYEDVSPDEIIQEVDAFSKLLVSLQDSVKYIFVPTWVISQKSKLFGMLDMKEGSGIGNHLMRMNLRLAENFKNCSNLYLLSAQGWFDHAGKGAFNPKLWYMAKVPFGNEVFKEATREIKSSIRGISGESKKIIILDLDNTLWGGIVGDDGWENIMLGGHDPIGEAYVDFQLALKAVMRKGILLGIISKNTESTALEAINNHPEMVLRLKDFSARRINWEDKAKNVLDLMAELNLGLESMVFIDDNPAERARVQEAFPEALVPEWPQNPMHYKSFFLSLDCFNSPSLTKEDLSRTKMYAAEKKRNEVREELGSYEDWLKTLEIKLKIANLDKSNLQRASQLLNKTNQMNLSTRRMSEEELLAWSKKKQRKIWVVRVSDKFGDMGLIGLVSLDVNCQKGQIIDFVLSCRVMGRMAEEAMLCAVIKYSKVLGVDEVWAKYLPTAKNIPCLEFWKHKSGFEYNELENTFHMEVKRDYPVPNCIKIEETLE